MPTTMTPARLRRRWQNADHDERRDLIVEVAMDLLGRRGLDAVTMRAVAARLGVGAMTLYTYVNNQQQMRREMIRRGFDMLNSSCEQETDPDAEPEWRCGAEAYVRFAVANPNLYRLMFSTPSITRDDLELVRGGFQSLLDAVREQLTSQGMRGSKLEQVASQKAGRFWVALHGLASLAIDGRIGIIGSDINELLDDLVPRVAPDR